MKIHFEKFLYTKNGKIILSILLGFGLASLFRTVCKGQKCLVYYAPPLEDFKDKIYKVNNKCVKYIPVSTKCSTNSNTKIINFE